MSRENNACQAKVLSGKGLFGFGLGYMNGSTLYYVSAYDATGGIGLPDRRATLDIFS